MIIMLCSQKGGCGKSTLAVNISTYLANQKKDCMLVDSDIQGTASTWITDRDENPNLSKIHSIQKYGNVRNALLDLKKRYEYVIVDSPGRDSREMRTGISTADVLLVPLKSSQPDLDTLPKMKEIIEEGKDFNPKLKVMLVLTMVSTNPAVTEKEESIEYLKQYPEFYTANAMIHERKIYRDCMSQGKSVMEMTSQSKKKANQEIKQLVEEIEQLCRK